MKASAQGVYMIQLEDRMEHSGIKWTKQRTAIIHVIMEKGARLLTAEEVFLLTKSHLPKLGMATVYRTWNCASKHVCFARFLIIGQPDIVFALLN